MPRSFRDSCPASRVRSAKPGGRFGRLTQLARLSVLPDAALTAGTALPNSRDGLRNVSTGVGRLGELYKDGVSSAS